MKNYLFLFTITPVQSFIAEARKAQDFFVGSYQLSWLTDCAIDKAQKNPSCEIIFPNTTIKSKPNRFMAIVESDDIKKFGDELKSYVEDNFRAWVDESQLSLIEGAEVPKDFDEKEFWKNYDSQQENYLSITWVAVEYDKEKGESDNDYYKAKYKEIESLLGGAKNIRDFAQLPDTEKGRKCSICGVRNALIFKSQPGSISQKGYKIINDEFFRMNEKEGLCAICAAKRFDEKVFDKPKKQYKFPSTSDIALLWTREQFKAKGEEIKENCDSQYLIMLKYQDDPPSFEHLEKKDKDDMKTMFAQIKDKKIPITPYYALVAFDGDSMGETLGGDKLKDDKNLKNFQNELSKALGDFAKKVKIEGIGNNEGRVVYAGGEDFFGFINLHYLFPVMTRLRQMFDEEVHNKLKDHLAEGEKLSFSAGITIAHVKTPLSVVIGKTREMEKKAKNRSPQKDAFAIAVMKHSGEINEIEMPWRNKAEEFYLDKMNELLNCMSDGTLSNTFYQVLQKEFLPIVDESGDIYEWEALRFKDQKPIIDEQYKKLLEMLDKEIDRTAARAVSVQEQEKQGLGKKETDALKKEKINSVIGLIKDLIDGCITEGERGHHFSFQNFFHIFHIIDFITRETGGINEN